VPRRVCNRRFFGRSALRERLAAVVADRNSLQKHVWRARIILATAEGCGTVEIMRRAGVSKPCVRRWQERFMCEGVAGLLREKTRKPGLPPLATGAGRARGRVDAE
jgi:Winged helix-turn helix